MLFSAIAAPQILNQKPHSAFFSKKEKISEIQGAQTSIQFGGQLCKTPGSSGKSHGPDSERVLHHHLCDMSCYHPLVTLYSE